MLNLIVTVFMVSLATVLLVRSTLIMYQEFRDAPPLPPRRKRMPKKATREERHELAKLWSRDMELEAGLRFDGDELLPGYHKKEVKAVKVKKPSRDIGICPRGGPHRWTNAFDEDGTEFYFCHACGETADTPNHKHDWHADAHGMIRCDCGATRDKLGYKYVGPLV